MRVGVGEVSFSVMMSDGDLGRVDNAVYEEEEKKSSSEQNESGDDESEGGCPCTAPLLLL